MWGLISILSSEAVPRGEPLTVNISTRRTGPFVAKEAAKIETKVAASSINVLLSESAVRRNVHHELIDIPPQGWVF